MKKKVNRKKQSFSLFQFNTDVLRQTHTAKAWLLTILAFLLGMTINFSPVAIGTWLLFRGEILKAILIPIILYLIIGFYMSFWFVIAILMFISGWIEYGFLESLFGTAIFVSIMFVFLFGPEWLLYRAHVASTKAETIRMDRVRRDEFEAEVSEDEFEEHNQKEQEALYDGEGSAYRAEEFTDSGKEFTSEQSTHFETEDTGIEESSDDLREKIAEKQAFISELTDELISLKNELTIFEAEYHGRVGVLYVRLDDLELAIKEYLRRIELLRACAKITSHS